MWYVVIEVVCITIIVHVRKVYLCTTFVKVDSNLRNPSGSDEHEGFKMWMGVTVRVGVSDGEVM